MTRALLLLTVLYAAGCGASPPKDQTTTAPGTHGGVKLLHQIMFDHAGDVQVFDGYMITDGVRLMVRAFAGPGVDLFTVVRDGAAHQETLHIASLAGRIDMPAVGADIARVYLGGCTPRTPATSVTCDFFGEPMTETFDAQGRLERREFPLAHSIGVSIHYREYGGGSAPWSARAIELTWGKSANRMLIRLVGEEPLTALDPALFRVTP